MKNKIIFLLAFFILLTILPIKTSAFWWFNQKKTVATTTVSTNVLSEQDKINLNNKYKNWEAAFEKKNVEAVIANKDKFSFSVSEINYLFATVSKNIKNPTLTNVGITVSNGNINASANFHKFISGRFSFIANVVSVENKIRLKLSYVKLYGISIPTKWLEEPVNKELDKYFSFLYKDQRYKGFTFTAQDNLLQLKPNF